MFGDILKEIREDKGFTQSDLAELLNLSRSTITSYENNINEPSFQILIKIADVFGVSIDYLLGRTPEKHNLNLEQAVNKDLLLKIYKILNEYDIKKK